jgi:hypothetical protein
LRPGVVTLSHGWGDTDDGVNVNRLVSADRYIESINAMARMTGIPVNIVKTTAGHAG